MTAPVFCPECGARVPTYAEDIVSARAGYRRRLQTLYLVSAVVIGIVFVRLLDWWEASEPSLAPAAIPAVSIQPTIEVRAVIEWPTATSTNTPRPTAVPTSTPVSMDTIYPACDGTQPGGSLCRPERPPSTPTPFPVCEAEFYPAVCRVPGDAETLSAEVETR